MKKPRLFTSLCLLALTFACLTFGVYSAVKTSFTASGTITFNAYGIDLDIDMSFAGTKTAVPTKYVSTDKNRAQHLTSGQTYTDISAGVTGLALVFDELTIPEGKTKPELKITITLNVKNYSGFPIAATPTLKFGASGAEATETFDGTFTSTVTNKVFSLADKATAAITISISPKNPATAITSNNNFKFEFEFAPYNYTSYYASQGYTLLENGKDGITISNEALSGKYTGTATKIMIPEGVTSIGNSAFLACKNLTSIAIPEGVTSIGNNTFGACTSLTTITIPSSVTRIGSCVFSNCDELTSIMVESENTVYDSRDNCNAIIEKSTKTLILGCQKTVIPVSVTSIGGSAFYDCGSLTTIAIPSSVTSIGDSAFYGCSKLTSIAIPSSVTSIGSSAFSGCSSLTSLTIEGATATNWAYGDSSNVTYATGTKIDLTNPATNATYFVKTKYSNFFVKQA